MANRKDSLYNDKLDSLRNDHFQQIRGSFFDNYTQRASLIPEEKPKENSSMEDQKFREELLKYLSTNNFSILHKKILDEEMSTKELCSLQDERISELVEEENKEKIPDLKKFLNDLDDARDYENLLKKIDKNVLNGKIFINLAENTENAEKI
jgi:regulator of sigma D